MSFLVRTEEAVKTLVDFLAADVNGSTATGDVNELFAPVQESKNVPIDVQIGFLVAPVAHRVPLYYAVPHETSSGSLCVITPPPQREYKDKVFELSEQGDAVARRVRRVIDGEKLAAKVIGPVAIRAFAKSYDHFIVYGLRKYPSQLAGEFLEHRRVPVWVSRAGKFEDKLHEAVRTVVVPRRGESAVTCRVGHTGLSVQEIVENIVALMDTLVKDREGVALKNILHVRVSATASHSKQIGLPIYGHVFHFSAPTEKAKAATEDAPAAKEAAPAAKRSKVEASH